METAEKNNASQKMTTLSEAMDHATEKGYTANFRIEEGGLTWNSDGKFYSPNDVKILNFYRFEGDSSPEDSAILYLVETSGGEKGTLTESYGAYSDEFTSAFIKEVEEIEKKQKSS